MTLLSAARVSRYEMVTWAIVVAATIVRFIAAARLPLSGDEAYYWEWSRRLAFGYFDHPPMVAWLIALFSLGIKSTLLIRLPFVLAGLGTAITIAAFVNRSTDDRNAGATAALILSLAPFATIAFTVASPDGPFLFFWGLSLYLTLRSVQPLRPAIWPALALAVAACILSRVLGGLLVIGIALGLARWTREVHAGQRRSIAIFALAAGFVAAAAVAPYLLWDASHGWSALHFALAGRHDTTFHGGNILSLLGLWAAVLTPGVFVAAMWAWVASAPSKTPGMTIAFATATPMVAVCLGLSLRERVEFYWADGAFVSLIIAIGIHAHTLLRGVRYPLVIAPAALIATLLLIVAAFPLETYRFAQAYLGLKLSHAGPFEIWSFEPAAHEVSREARRDHAWVMTDGYGLSSVLDYYGDIEPVVIGYDQQGREARSWAVGIVPSRAIFFDKEPLRTRPDFAMRLQRACSRVMDDGERTYYHDGVLTRSFYLTRCEGLTPDGFALLRFTDRAP